MKKYIGKYKKEGLPGGPNEIETSMHGFIVTNEGQWKYPGQPTLIPSNEITMKGVDFPVLGIDDTGHSKMMMPGADYTFPGSMVYELPMAQDGKSVSQNWQAVTGTPWSKAKELGLTKGKYTENLELQKKFLADPEYYRDLAQGRQDMATIESVPIEQIPQPLTTSISRESTPVEETYQNIRGEEVQNADSTFNVTPLGLLTAAPDTITDPSLLQLPTMRTDLEDDTTESFVGEGSWNRLAAPGLISETGEFAKEYFDPLTGEAIGEFIPTVKSSELLTPGPNAYQANMSKCDQDQCSAGMQYNIVSHLEGGWDELKNKLGVTGDAWTMNQNIINAGGQRIYGLGEDMNIDRNKNYSSKDVRQELYKARKKHDLDKVYESAQVGDIVEMYYPNSGSQKEAIRTGKGNTYTTHVGHVTEKDGVKYVTHNVHGTWHTDKLDTLLKRSGSRSGTKGTTVSGIIRPDYGWRESQNQSVSISEQPVQAISSSGDRNYYTTEDEGSIKRWQSKAITPVAKQFVQGLEAVAPDIAADFGLSNDQLALIMKTSFGSFGSESGFGISDTYKNKERGRKVTRAYKEITPDWMPEGDEQSEGLTQIKLENAFNDPKAKSLLKKYGISDVEQLYDPMYSSIATMLLTAMNYKQFESATGLKAEDIDPITMQNIMLLAHNKGMNNVINKDFVEEGEFKRLHQLRRKGHKYKDGKEPKLTDQSVLDGLETYSNIHMDPSSYTNKAGDFAASLNVDVPKMLERKEARQEYTPQESPEAYGVGETLLQYAHNLVRDESYAKDKERLLAKIESAKIEAIKNAEKLHKGSKRKLNQALSKIERDSRKAINVIQNTGKKVVRKANSIFEEGGSVNDKIYLGKYTMVKKAQDGGESIPSVDQMFSGIPEETVIEFNPNTGEQLNYVNPNFNALPNPMDYSALLHRQAFQESSFRDDVITGKTKSPAGAMGLAQFMPETIEDMRRLKFIDDSFDPYDTKQASIAQKQYMDWLAERPYLAKGDAVVQQAKVLAAYNRGHNAIKDVLTKAKQDGYDIYQSMDWINHPSMPKETREYVENILLKASPKYERDYESVKDRYRNLYFKQDGGVLPPDYELFREHPGGAPYAYDAPQVNGVLLPDPNRPNMPGTNATEYKVEWDGITMPSIVNGTNLGPQGALDRYLLTGEHYPETVDPGSYSKFYDTVYPLGLMKYGKGGLKQWFAEDWRDIKTGKKCGRGKDEKGRPYPACRPANRVNETTPKTINEMSSSEKEKFRRAKRGSKRINYNHKRNNKNNK